MTDNPFPEMNNPYQAPAMDAGLVDDASESSRTVNLLRQTGPWVRFFAILGLIVSVMLIFGGLAVGIIVLSDRGELQGIVIAIMCPMLGLLFGIGAYYLSLYATNIKKYTQQPSLDGLNAALQSQKSFWCFTGIITAIVFVIYLVILLGACLIGSANEFR